VDDGRIVTLAQRHHGSVFRQDLLVLAVIGSVHRKCFRRTREDDEPEATAGVGEGLVPARANLHGRGRQRNARLVQPFLRSPCEIRVVTSESQKLRNL